MKLLHTRFRVSNMEQSIAFYEKLGLTVSRKTISPRGFPLVFLDCEGVELELVQLPGEFSVPDDLMHIAFAVSNLDSYKLVDGPHKSSSGRIGFMLDPDGYEIELIERR
jgi:lactoylglutathione lyase